MMNTKTIAWVMCFGFLVLGAFDVTAQTTEFTYQGELAQGVQPANGQFDFEFKLFNSETDGTQMSDTNSLDDVQVTGGVFTVSLDFGDDAQNFSGSGRWLEIYVRPGVSTNPGDFVKLIPRQKITATPYSLHTRGIFVSDDGDVGIGTNSPQFDLHVNRSGNPLDSPSTTMGLRTLETSLPSEEGWIYLRNSEVASSIRRESGTPLYIGTEDEIGGSLTTQFVINSDGNVGVGNAFPEVRLDVGGDAKISGDVAVTGSLGVGTSSPVAKMQIEGGSEISITSGGSFVIGDVTDANLAFDSNELMARHSGSVAPLFINHKGGTVSIGGAAIEFIRVGIGTTAPTESLDLGGGNIAMGYEIVSVDSSAQQFNISCPSGKRVIGGGCREQDNDEWILASYPLNNTTWNCKFDSEPEDFPSFGYAICANIR